MDLDAYDAVLSLGISGIIAYFVMKLRPMDSLYVAGICLVSGVLAKWARMYIGELPELGAPGPEQSSSN